MKYKYNVFMSFCLAVSIALLSAVCMPCETEAASLYNPNGLRNMFVDRKASQVGDILTIIISESTSTSTTKNTSNSKEGEQSIAAGVGIFRGIMGGLASQEDSFKATGSSTNTNRVNANITVTVVEVLPNGNLVIEGTQSIWQQNNENKITIRGIVRPDDISINNTVLSSRVSDATLKFDGKGPLNAKQRQGILTQIFNFLF